MDGRVDGWKGKRENGDFLSGGVGGGDGGLRLGRVAQAAGEKAGGCRRWGDITLPGGGLEEGVVDSAD